MPIPNGDWLSGPPSRIESGTLLLLPVKASSVSSGGLNGKPVKRFPWSSTPSVSQCTTSNSPGAIFSDGGKAQLVVRVSPATICVTNKEVLSKEIESGPTFLSSMRSVPRSS